MRRLIAASLLFAGAMFGQVCNSTACIPVANIAGLAPSATTDTTNASNVTSGTLPHAQLPALLSTDIPANTSGTGLNGSVLSTSSTSIQKLDGAGHLTNASAPTDYLKPSGHAADTGVTVVANGQHTQTLASSGLAAGFYQLNVAVTVTTAATGTCAGPIALSATNDFGAVTPVISAGPTLTSAAGTMAFVNYSFWDAGTTATSVTLTAGSGCTGSGVYNMYSVLTRLF